MPKIVVGSPNLAIVVGISLLLAVNDVSTGAVPEAEPTNEIWVLTTAKKIIVKKTINEKIFFII